MRCQSAEITSRILSKQDEENGNRLLDEFLGVAKQKDCDQGGQKHGRGRLIIRMPPWVWGCANSRLQR